MRRSTADLQRDAQRVHDQAAELVDLVNMYRPRGGITEILPDPQIDGGLRGVALSQIRRWTAERDRLVILLLRYLSLEDVRRRHLDALPASHRYRADL